MGINRRAKDLLCLRPLEALPCHRWLLIKGGDWDGDGGGQPHKTPLSPTPAPINHQGSLDQLGLCSARQGISFTHRWKAPPRHGGPGSRENSGATMVFQWTSIHFWFLHIEKKHLAGWCCVSSVSPGVCLSVSWSLSSSNCLMFLVHVLVSSLDQSS